MAFIWNSVVSLLVLVVLAAAIGSAAYTWVKSVAFERQFPPLGTFVRVDQRLVHYIDHPASDPTPDHVPLFFVHGASGNLRDPRLAFADSLGETQRLIFADRPGHGHSDYLPGHADPRRQAAHLVGLMDELNIDQVVLVGHSMGAAVAVTLAVDYPERVVGLLLLAPATHPWPGGVAWHNHVAAIPLIGHAFTHMVTLPVGLDRLEEAVDTTFWPQRKPGTYLNDIGAFLALRPKAFRVNAAEIAALHRHVTAYRERYSEIRVPVEIVTGDADQTVLWTIHSRGLEADITDAHLTIIPNGGHMPHHSHPDVVSEALKRLLDRVADPAQVGLLGQMSSTHTEALGGLINEKTAPREVGLG